MSQQRVRIKYTWQIRKKMLLSLLLHYSQPVVRPLLRAWDRVTYGYKAEGYDDLSLGEWLRVKWCELHGRHVGKRTNLSGMRYCNYCQCAWTKFDRTYDADGRRIRPIGASSR